jgi:hypothetical protein
MKFALLGIVFLSFAAQAVTPDQVFRRDTQLPQELQQRVLNKALTCGAYVAHWSLQERATTVRVDRVDQGIVDFYYTTELTVQYYFDGTHPMSYSIFVESAQIEVNNPPSARWQIGDVSCPQL